MSSLNDMVSAIATTISPVLIAPRSLEAIGQVAQHLPLTLGATVGFECPLATAAAEADFFLRVSGAWGRSLLTGQPQRPPILEQLQLEPAVCPPGFADLWQETPWQYIRQFAQRWADPTSLLHAAIDDMWLEFDVATRLHESVDDVPVENNPHPLPLPSSLPSSFFGLTTPEGVSLDWVSQTALPLLRGEALSTGAKQTLKHCFTAIPASAKPFQVGTLSGRVSSQNRSPAIRLYIRDLQLNQLKQMLKRLDWPGNETLLTQAIASVATDPGNFSLQLEIQDTLSPTIAVECYLPQRTAWEKALNRLVIAGFCTPQRAQALLTYPGYVRAQDDNQSDDQEDSDTPRPLAFPTLLKRWSNQLAPYRECLLVKRLAYLKFTCEPDYPLSAKAYLGLSPTWVDTRYLEPSAAPDTLSADQESIAIGLCKALVQQLDYNEVDVDGLFSYQRSQKSRWLNKALETICVGG